MDTLLISDTGVYAIATLFPMLLSNYDCGLSESECDETATGGVGLTVDSYPCLVGSHDSALKRQ